jgi:hypothetical protein
MTTAKDYGKSTILPQSLEAVMSYLLSHRTSEVASNFQDGAYPSKTSKMCKSCIRNLLKNPNTQLKSYHFTLKTRCQN